MSYSNNDGLVIHNGLESSFVEDVKSKENKDLLLVKLKKSSAKKSVEVFSKGGDGVLS